MKKNPLMKILILKWNNVCIFYKIFLFLKQFLNLKRYYLTEYGSLQMLIKFWLNYLKFEEACRFFH